jgi:hypothetical protein
MPVGGDHLLVVDTRGTKCLLHPATWMHPRAPSSPWHTYSVGVSAIIGPPVLLQLMLAVGGKDAASQSRLPNTAEPLDGRTGTNSSLARSPDSDAPLRYGRAAPRAS